MNQFETSSELVEDNSPIKPLQPKVYEATFSKYDGEVKRKYYSTERLIEAATEANDLVKDDPFTTLVSIAELGPLE